MNVIHEVVPNPYIVTKNGEPLSEHADQEMAKSAAITAASEDRLSDVRYKHELEVMVRVSGANVSVENAIVVDGRMWVTLLPPNQILDATVEVTGGDFLTFIIRRTANLIAGPVYVGYMNWPQPVVAADVYGGSGISFTRSEHPPTFYIKSGDYFVHFVGPSMAVSGGYNLLGVPFKEGQTEASFEIHWSRSADDVDIKKRVLDEFRDLYPMLLNWPDRRPIGLSFPNQHINGNKWIWDWTNQAEFEAGFHAHIDQCITNCLAANAQGLLIWCIEGQSMGHPISYVGDPARHAQFCPETTFPLIQQIFEKTL